MDFRGRPLSKYKTYTLATNDFLAKGGDGYSVFKNYPFFGVGNKNYRVETCRKPQNIDQAKFEYVCSTHPHQIYIELLSEHGLVGFILILFLVTAYVIYLNIGENPLSNKEAMIASATIQKFIAFMSVATVFSLSFGFSKRINNSK